MRKRYKKLWHTRIPYLRGCLFNFCNCCNSCFTLKRGSCLEISFLYLFFDPKVGPFIIRLVIIITPLPMVPKTTATGVLTWTAMSWWWVHFSAALLIQKTSLEISAASKLPPSKYRTRGHDTEEFNSKTAMFWFKAHVSYAVLLSASWSWKACQLSLQNWCWYWFPHQYARWSGQPPTRLQHTSRTTFCVETK